MRREPLVFFGRGVRCVPTPPCLCNRRPLLQVVLIHLHSYDYYTMSDEASVAQFLHRVDEGKVPKDNMRSIWRSLTG